MNEASEQEVDKEIALTHNLLRRISDPEARKQMAVKIVVRTALAGGLSPVDCLGILEFAKFALYEVCKETGRL